MSRPAASAADAAPGRRRRSFLVAGAAVALVLLALAAWWSVSSTSQLRRSEVYAEAVERARSHPRVLAALGQPIEPGRWVRGAVAADGPTGRARLTVPLAGPDGLGRLHAEARRQGEVWRFERLEVSLPDGTVVDLLAAPPPPADTGTLAAAALPGTPSPPSPAPPAPWHDVRIERRS